jgi:predicted XRE-type DNA-binding protein
MKTKTIIQIIRAEIRKSPFTQAEIGRYTGVEKATITRVMQGGDCKTATADRLLKFFKYAVKPEGSGKV